MLALDIKNLQKTYAGGVQAIKKMNLEIKEGEFFALLGSNGAGKTTTIGILTGLVNKTGGAISVFGYDLDTDLNNVKQQIGVVPQEFNLNFFEKVIDIVVQQAGYYGIDTKTAYERAEDLLKKLELWDKRNTIAMQLSGGMKRRVMIARGLVHRPKLLILDEPTAGVDVKLRHGMWEYLKELNESGVTILLTTHYLEEVEQLCDRAAIINKGKIETIDTVKNLLRSLDKEYYVIETKKEIAEDFKLPSEFELTRIDDHTLEAAVNKNQDINSLIDLLTKSKIEVAGIRPKGNRLEELFLNVTKK